MNNPDMSKPYYTAEAMYNLGVYNEDTKINMYRTKASEDNIKWYEEYSNTGNYGDNYEQTLKEYVLQLAADPNNDTIKQTILEFGWNPEIALLIIS